jgi:TolB-like protein
METADYPFGSFVFDSRRKMLLRGREPLSVGHKGLALLQTLLKAAGEPVSKSDLLDAAWPGATVEESNLTVQIATLRRLLGRSPEGGEWIITVPRLGYRFAHAVEPQSDAAPAFNGLDADVAPEPASATPSVAVLPLVNTSGDPEQDYLADGITEDIITALNRCRWFFVTSRNSSFLYKDRSIDTRQIAGELDVRYLLEGSVRKSGDTVRVSVQLVDAPVGRDIWAQRYDLQSDDFFVIQDEIAQRVVGAIEPELLKTESALAISRSGSKSALDLVRRGTWYFHKVNRENHIKARELFRQALAIDPDLIEANMWLGRVAGGIVAYGWADDPETEITEGVAAAQKAVQLDGLNPYSHYSLAISSLFANNPEQAVSAAEAAIETNPSFALGYLALGLGQLSDDQAANAIDSLQRGLELNAHDPQNFVWYNLLSVAYLITDRPKQALLAAQKGARVRPAWRPIIEKLAICHAANGQPEEAGRAAEQALRLEESNDNMLGPLRHFHPQRASLIDAMLRQLGL